MTLIKAAKTILVMTGTLGVLMPRCVLAEQRPSVEPQAAQIQDVRLADGGLLRGQVVNKSGQPQRKSPVILRNREGELFRATTDQHGRFAVTGLRSGVYFVASEGSESTIRAWTRHAAPPVASNAMLLISDDFTVRGKGKRKGKGGGGFGGLSMSQIGLGGLLVAGATAAILAVALDDDAS